MKLENAEFDVGQLVGHRLFGYRGVIFDIDGEFKGSDEWYARMARSRSPRDRPWYHVLVHRAGHTTYVAEQNLEPDLVGGPIIHPALGHFFGTFEHDRYLTSQALN